MELMIRDAVLADCPVITRLNREEMGYDYPQDKTFAKLQACLANPAHKILAAEREGKVVGYLHLETYDLLYADSMVNVLGIAVSRDCRRQGVGKALLSAGRPGPSLWEQRPSAWFPGRRERALTPFTKAWGIRATSSSGTSKNICKGCGGNRLPFHGGETEIYEENVKSQIFQKSHLTFTDHVITIVLALGNKEC